MAPCGSHPLPLINVDFCKAFWFPMAVPLNDCEAVMSVYGFEFGNVEVSAKRSWAHIGQIADAGLPQLHCCR